MERERKRERERERQMGGGQVLLFRFVHIFFQLILSFVYTGITDHDGSYLMTSAELAFAVYPKHDKCA